ncbi:hypothetical protein Tsubulata_035519 [Turnera subulata]|uniref:DRBM domain-containing protein n=1 Tax=Turnera subulata TaxID=218843 RepID=A0A9Q0JNV0_9ROSI|nr:hypothetical protein Tsubulata_035519 [Turnera subulata]
MEDSDLRKQRLNAMRAMAAHNETSSSSTNSGTFAAPPFLANPLLDNPPMQDHLRATQRFDFYTDPMAAFSGDRKSSSMAQDYSAPPSNVGPPVPRVSSPYQGLSNCYVFKSRLQEFAQKLKLSSPVYETIKEGPSHEPSFRSTVIVNGTRYDSLPGFYNRKAAEHSAAEIALIELAKSGELSNNVSLPVHEIGLSKNLLQEYAQKMNYAIPVYKCEKEETPGHAAHFKCSVEIGGIKYIGASVKTKKEAEIKAARVALLDIQLRAPDTQIGGSRLTVIPCKKRGAETARVSEETANAPKAKKGRVRKNMLKRKRSGDRLHHAQGEVPASLDRIVEVQGGAQIGQTTGPAVQGAEVKQTNGPAVQGVEVKQTNGPAVQGAEIEKINGSAVQVV